MKTLWLQHVAQRVLRTRIVLGLFLLSCVVALTVGVAYAYPPPAQIFYITLPEADALTVLSAIHPDAVPPTYTYFSIAVGFDNTYVYYDQWEDGYAADIANPTSGEIYSSTNLDGVQIWGNGLAADGCAPNLEGVPLTCTDGNDVLYAGNVIIPYNIVEVPRVAAAQSYVLDTFSTVAYNSNNGNTNWSSDWVETGDDVNPNYRDEFASQSYSLSVGSIPWTTSWTEVNDDGSASSGYVRIDTANGLRFGRGSSNTAAGVAIYRAADLSGYTSATLSYSFSESASAADDAVQVQVRNPGTTGWFTLATIDGTMGSGTGSHDITAYMDSDTEVRFRVSSQIEAGEYIYFDNVDISLTPSGASGPGAGDILITSGQLRFSQTEANDSIDRGVSLPTGDACATLSFTLGQTGIDATGDNFAVQVSSDGVSYTTLETYDTPGDAGAKSYPISVHAAANTRVRFISIDALETGEYWTVDNVRVEWDCALPIVFDASDKIGASDLIAMARAVWASGSGTLNAYAHEMYSTGEWGLVYESPVGSNTGAVGDASRYQFEYSALTIMASQNNTQVQIDADANGTYETTVTLQEGGSTLATGILQGARVQASNPVQVALLTGDIGDTYESRDMSLLPVSNWGNSYWSPVGVMWNANPTRLYLYNLSTNASIYVTCERYGVSNTTLGPVAARGVVTIDLGANQGARCYASDSGGNATGEKFFGIGTIDTAPGDSGGDDGSRSDWSVTLYPQGFLTTEALVGLGLGKDPYDTSSTENGSPLWVTAACSTGSTYVYVDWDNDGVADPVDTDGDDVAEAGSENGILVQRLQSVRLFEPGADEEEYDQTGARIWTRTASGVGYGGTAGCNLSVAWGQDPPNATAGSPGLDVGTSIPPLRKGPPTAVRLVRFEATGFDDHVLVQWTTAQELDNVGFSLYRTDAPDFDDSSRVDLGFIPAQHTGQIWGAAYSYTDTDIRGGTAYTYYYWLEDVDFHGSSTRHGPVPVSSPVETPASLPVFVSSRVDMLEST
jgi:hypothetical protein